MKWLGVILFMAVILGIFAGCIIGLTHVIKEMGLLDMNVTNFAGQ